MMKRSLYSKSLFIASLVLFCAQVSSAQDEQQRAHRDYISALEGISDGKFTAILIAELEHYMATYPGTPDLDKIHFKIATLHYDRGDEMAAFCEHLSMLYRYPDSDLIAVAKDRLRSLIIKERKFKPLRDRADAILNPKFSPSTREAADFQFIKDMVTLAFKPASELLIRRCERFIKAYPNSTKDDAVRFWYGELLLQRGKHRQALAEFLKLTFFHGESLKATAAKLKIAQIFNEDLDMPKKAVLTLEEFLLEYPDDPQAPQAQFQIAKINAKELKKYTEAINAYSEIAKKYPQSLEAVPALFEAAALYEKKFKAYDQAIRIYTEVVRDFPDDIKAPYAFAEAARIYEDKLDDPLNAANVYFKIYGNYPKSGIAAESLFAAAEINERKLQDNEKALMYYRFLVDNYAEHKLARRAQKRIDKLSKKLSAK